MKKIKKKPKQLQITSKHYSEKRYNREQFIKEHIGGGKIIKSFVVDKGHKDGLEVHYLTSTGLIIIKNKRTKKLITKLIARPQQIKRYYKASNKSPPKWLLDIAFQHQKMGYNEKI